MNNYDNLKEAERKAGFPFVRYWQTVLDAVKDICTETEKMLNSCKGKIQNPKMECMDSPKKSRDSCGYSCSHVGVNKTLIALSFAVCFLIVWNISLQYQIYSVSVALNACTKNDVKKESMPNGAEKLENQVTKPKVLFYSLYCSCFFLR
jgi:hypothetical protein